jgi:hypothetical protein
VGHLKFILRKHICLDLLFGRQQSARPNDQISSLLRTWLSNFDGLSATCTCACCVGGDGDDGCTTTLSWAAHNSGVPPPPAAFAALSFLPWQQWGVEHLARSLGHARRCSRRAARQEKYRAYGASPWSAVHLRIDRSGGVLMASAGMPDGLPRCPRRAAAVASSYRPEGEEGAAIEPRLGCSAAYHSEHAE